MANEKEGNGCTVHVVALLVLSDSVSNPADFSLSDHFSRKYMKKLGSMVSLKLGLDWLLFRRGKIEKRFKS